VMFVLRSGAGQEQGFPWSLGSGNASRCHCAPFSSLDLFCFRHVGIESHTRVESNVMEITDIYTADTKVILADIYPDNRISD